MKYSCSVGILYYYKLTGYTTTPNIHGRRHISKQTLLYQMAHLNTILFKRIKYSGAVEFWRQYWPSSQINKLHLKAKKAI